MKTYTVYILYSPSSQAFYKGQTQDIQDRLRRHNAGMENATEPGSTLVTALDYSEG